MDGDSTFTLVHIGNKRGKINNNSIIVENTMQEIISNWSSNTIAICRPHLILNRLIKEIGE